MSGIDFAAPQWFLLSLVLPFALGLKVWSRSRGVKAVEKLVAPSLRRQLVQKASPGTEWLVFLLQLFAVFFLILAAARPQWGDRVEETFTDGRNLFIAMDTSRSMLAEDLAPNRLERAKLTAKDLIRNLRGDRIGLIAFAGKPFVLAPLTVDHDAVLEAVEQLDTDVVPRGGTNVIQPVLLAMKTMKEANAPLGALILFSDGEDWEGKEEWASFRKQTKDSQLLVITIGVGTESGGIVPDLKKGPGHFVRDETGEVVRSTLQPEALQQLSEETSGTYVTMGQRSSVSEVVQRALRRLETQKLQAGEERIPIERYGIPLFLGMLLLVLSHLAPRMSSAGATVGSLGGPTRGLVGVISLGVFFLGFSTRTEADEGLKQYEKGQYPESQAAYLGQMARALFPQEKQRLAMGLGAAALRGGDSGGAKQAFAETLLSSDPRLQFQAHYNLGQALYQSGRKQFAEGQRNGAISELELAIRHFEASLRLKPQSRASRENADFIREQLEKLKQLPPPPPPEDNPSPSSEPPPPDNQQPPPNQPPPSPPEGSPPPPP
ncbi:MAG: VWA domain-containing protein, partial [Verrucomicrobiota bacterium]